MPQAPAPESNEGGSALSLAAITERVPPLVAQEIQQAAQQVQPEILQTLQPILAAAVAQALEPLTQHLQATLEQLQALQQVPRQLQELRLLVRDRAACSIARNRNSVLCMGPGKERVPLRWPQHQGKPVPALLGGKRRPSTVKGVMKCSSSVIDGILEFYDQPLLGSSEVRRKRLLEYLGVYSC
eukprot:GHUV01005011.1.p1 GENE.GHUV01005011.1~~GHUV01005011.1.p1  ORF type:complete len:184 (+),score=57.18 GHUV01005011.1:423-974(+)